MTSRTLAARALLQAAHPGITNPESPFQAPERSPNDRRQHDRGDGLGGLDDTTEIGFRLAYQPGEILPASNFNSGTPSKADVAPAVRLLPVPGMLRIQAPRGDCLKFRFDTGFLVADEVEAGVPGPEVVGIIASRWPPSVTLPESGRTKKLEF